MEKMTTDCVLLEEIQFAPHLFAFAGGRAVVCSWRCPFKETANEDALALLPTGDSAGVIVLADGCGGMAHGELAARTAIQAVQQHVAGASKAEGTLRPAILDGIEQANQQVLQLGGGSATTMAIAEIDGMALRTYHVGDSTIMLLGNRGRVKLQTMSHSPVGYAVEAGVLDERDAIWHADRHLVSNVIGCPESRIEISSCRKMSARDTVVVGSDGLFDNLHIGEIVEITRKGPLLRCAKELADRAFQRMTQIEPGEPSKPDDLSFVLFRPC